MDFENILEDLGSFGHWQRVIFTLICMPDVFGAFAILIPVFTGAIPRWQCNSFAFGGPNSTVHEVLSPGDGEEQCFLNGSIPCVNMTFYDDFTSIVSEWKLVCSLSYVSDLINTIQMVGLLLGAACFAQISDTIGRKKAYFIAFGILVTPGLLSAFSPNWQIYAIFRFFVGVGFGGIYVVSWVYPTEFVGVQWRLITGTLGFWQLGHCFLALCAYLVRDWRHLTILTTATGYIYYSVWFIIPESPRWLARQNRLVEARDVLRTIAERNDKPCPDLSILDEVAEADRQEEEMMKKYTYIDLFRNKVYCRQAFVVAVLWFVVYTTYYGATFNLRTLSGNRFLNIFYSALLEIAAVVTIIIMSKMCGRQTSQVIFITLTLLCNFIVLIVMVAGQADNLAYLILVASLFGKATSVGGVNVIGIWTVEIFPTVIRNVGTGIGSVAARVGGMLSPQIVFVGTLYNLAPSIIFIGLCAISLPLIFLLPETRCQPLEDNLEMQLEVGKFKESDCLQSDPSKTMLNDDTMMEDII